MKKYIFRSALLVAGLCFGCPGQATAQFKIGATIRPRSEYRDGFKTLPKTGSKPAFFIEQRSRLNLDYQSSQFNVGFSLQDIRIWGAAPQINKTDGFTSVHEAWGEMKFTPKFSLKVGRQELDYDDARILGNLDWAAQARSHDAAKFVYQDSTWALHAGASFNQDSRVAEGAKLFGTYYDPTLNNYKHLHYLWFKKSWSHVNVSLLGLNNGLQAPDSTVHFTQTLGGNVTFTTPTLRFDGAGYYQTGFDRTDTPVSAYLTSLNLTYTWGRKATFTVGGDVLSGSGKKDRVNRSFDPLYGTHHKFYGFMDYFYVGNPHRQAGNDRSTGLVDLYLKTSVKVTDKLVLNGHLHRFSSPVAVFAAGDEGRKLNAYLGTELDATFTYTWSKDVNLQGGYSQMLPTASLEILKGGSKDHVANWAWLMLTIKPTLFTSQKN
jgi:hypothetical protein